MNLLMNDKIKCSLTQNFFNAMESVHKLLEVLLFNPIFVSDGQDVAKSLISLEMMKHNS